LQNCDAEKQHTYVNNHIIFAPAAPASAFAQQHSSSSSSSIMIPTRHSINAIGLAYQQRADCPCKDIPGSQIQTRSVQHAAQFTQLTSWKLLQALRCRTVK
jgi:hypothetical protein